MAHGVARASGPCEDPNGRDARSTILLEALRKTAALSKRYARFRALARFAVLRGAARLPAFFAAGFCVDVFFDALFFDVLFFDVLFFDVLFFALPVEADFLPLFLAPAAREPGLITDS